MLVGQVFVTLMHGEVVTVVVQDAELVTLLPLHALVPVATTVSVKGPQPTGTVLVACQGALPPTAKPPTIEIVMSSAVFVVPLSSTTFTPTSGTLPQLLTTPLT